VKIVSLVLTLAGAILGPGYYLYCEFYSGKAVGTFHTGDRSTFELDPQMNQVAIIVSMAHSTNSSEYYLASLHSGGQRVTAGTFHASADATSVSMTLRTNVERRGEYQLQVARSTWPDRPIPSVEFKVRRNSRAPDLRLAGAGLVILVIGLLIGAKPAQPEG
jgi:hypothetical protein